jgi:DHA1 family multidrug resistance protein-like MFS transporter
MVLFFSSFILFFVGLGPFSLLPLYVAQFGATHSTAGMILALTSLAEAGGAMLSERLVARLSRKRLFILSGLAGTPALLLMSQARALWQIILAISLFWFFAGANLQLVNIFTAQMAGDQRRGRTFSLMSLTIPLGSLAGAAAAGWMVTWQGYEFLFAAFAAIWFSLPVLALWKLEGTKQLNGNQSSYETSKPVRRSKAGLVPLLATSLLTAIAINILRIGIPFSMQARNLGSGSVAGAISISSLIALPFILLVGELSDRADRKQMLILISSLATFGSLLLMHAGQPWHYWLVATLMMTTISTHGAIASALAVDLLSPDFLSRGLIRLKMAYISGGVLSFAGSGWITEAAGETSLYWIGTLLALAAITGAWQIQSGKPVTAKWKTAKSLWSVLDRAAQTLCTPNPKLQSLRQPPFVFCES